MAVPTIYPQDVINVINSLHNKKGNTHETPIFPIKTNMHQIAIPLSILFNQSIANSKFPHCLKHFTVIPIHKRGPKDSVGNHGPTFLINVYLNFFEKIMKRFLCHFLKSVLSIFKPEQFGFRQILSTFDALSFLTEDIYLGHKTFFS